MTLANESTAMLNSKERSNALVWLATLGDRAEKWAYRHTWQYLTLDVHSTQRAEAIHSALATIIANSDKLNRLLDKLTSFQHNSDLVKHRKQERIALVQVRACPPFSSASAMPSSHLACSLTLCRMSPSWTS